MRFPLAILPWLLGLLAPLPSHAAEDHFTEREQLALLGDAKAAMQLAENTTDPTLLAARETFARQLLQKDADRGEHYAMVRLAKYYINHDTKIAYHWLSKALKEEYPPALELMAQWLLQRPAEARLLNDWNDFLSHTLHSSNPDLWFQLGKLYATGQFGSTQSHLAQRAWQKAVQLGHISAAQELQRLAMIGM